MKSLYLLAICLLTGIAMPAVYGQTVSKEKKVSGRYPADRGKLVIDNRYGKLDVNTWDRNEVTVDITIMAKAKSASAAQELLDKVTIIEPKNSGTINYKTEIAKGKNVVDKSEFSINYIINMPRRHTADLLNKYGDIEIADVDGVLNIDLEYGGLETGAIRGDNNNIKVGFGAAEISSIEAGNIKCSYSRLSIDKAGSIDVSNQFGKTIIGTVRDLSIDQKYGDLKIASVNRLKGNAQYAGLTVDKLLKNMDMSLKYCTGAKFSYVGADVDNIRVNSSFSNVYYHFDNAASMSADMIISFGKVNNDAGNVTLTESQPGRPGGAATYKARIGSGRGNMAMNVSYGNVVFK